MRLYNNYKVDTVEPVQIYDKCIIKYIQERGIKGLVHFTKLDNLASILTYGIVPRTILEKYGMPFRYTDEKRCDTNKTDGFACTCLSITEPNRKMMHEKIDVRERPEVKWIVLILEPYILADKGAMFFDKNASDCDAHPATGLSGLRGMFDGDRTFNKYQYPRFPSDQQAEVGIRNIIPPELIKYVCCVCRDDVDDAKKIVKRRRPELRRLRIEERSEYFELRASYGSFTLS